MKLYVKETFFVQNILFGKRKFVQYFGRMLLTIT